MKHDNRYVWLDLARGISALLVCAGHLRAAMFVDYSQLSSTNLIDKVFYFCTGLGHQAVMIFFVLSGFFVGGSVLVRGNKFQFNNYCLARVSRLWVVLIPALIFTIFVDKIITLLAPDILSGNDFAILSSGPKESDSYSSSINTFFSNLVFLQNIYAPVFGTNGPLWSLANEFWYYMLFPAIVILINGKTHLLKKIISTLGIMLIVLFVANNMMDGFLIWLFGVVVYLMYSKDSLIIPSWVSLFTAILFIASLLDSKLLFFCKMTSISSDIIIGLCFSLFLISIRNKSIQYGRKYISISSKWLSEISYTLYLFHFPLVLLIYGLFYKDEQIILNSTGIMQYIFWLTLLFFISYVMWWLFERNTPLVRQYLKKHTTNT